MLLDWYMIYMELAKTIRKGKSDPLDQLARENNKYKDYNKKYMARDDGKRKYTTTNIFENIYQGLTGNSLILPSVQDVRQMLR